MMCGTLELTADVAQIRLRSNVKKSPNPYRQRLIEAMVYFSKKVRKPTKMMMYKLLAELDFRHFKQTGMPVTNLEYEAWKRGPVPRSLNEEITDQKDVILPPDLAEALDCAKTDWETSDGEKRVEFRFKAKRQPNLSIFTPRQKQILKDVAFIYSNATATMASNASHEVDTPWTKTVQEKGEGAVIDYLDQLDENSPVDREDAQERMKEIKAFHETYSQ